MTDLEFIQAELMAAKAAASEWEVVARRATAGARSSSKGAERLKRKVFRLEDTVKILEGRIERLTHESDEQRKKISRLSLELLSRISQGETGQQR